MCDPSRVAVGSLVRAMGFRSRQVVSSGPGPL
jgi:hypothetical protein